jgi:integrase
MARGERKLKAVALQSLPAGMHGDGGGLWLQVTPGGGRSWLFRFTRAGRAREMGLGPLHTVSLAEAREGALNCRKQLREGQDPIEVRKAKRAARRMPSFRECAEAYIAAHQVEWTNAKHRVAWSVTLATYAYPIFGDLPVSAIDKDLVMRALEPHWATKRESMSRLRGRIENVLAWAKVRGYRDGENPAHWRGHLSNLLSRPAKQAQDEHYNALPYVELPAFMAELRARAGMPARALEFLILTTARRDEVRLARWVEVDLAGRVWAVPEDRMKAGREHRVPLSEAATTLLEALPRRGPYLFPGHGSAPALAQNTMLYLLKAPLGRAGKATIHGFRSTFSDWAAEQTNAPSEVREMALAHAVGDKVEAAYRRGDLFEKRRQLAEAWAQYCDGEGARGEQGRSARRACGLKGRAAKLAENRRAGEIGCAIRWVSHEQPHRRRGRSEIAGSCLLAGCQSQA